MKYIYALTDPRDNQVRYIGQTDDMQNRLQQHIKERKSNPKCDWVKELVDAQLRPVMVQLATVTDDENAHHIEYRWIYFGRKNGWNLTNTTAMKSEEYYSLQGYFERLIVEMEKPSDMPVKQYSGEDVKQELLALLVKALKGFQSIGGNVSGMFSLASTNIAFALIAVLVCSATSSNANPNSSMANMGATVVGLSLVAIVILTLGLLFGSDEADHATKDMINTMLKRALRLVGAVSLVASLFPLMFGGS